MGTNEADCRTKRLKCEHCPKTFVHRKSLEQHILNHHGKDKLKIEPLHCSQCLKNKKVTRYFSKRHLLNEHIRLVHGQHRWKCNICLKTFSTRSKLRSHQRIHSTNVDTKWIKFKCEICSKVFSVKHRFQVHLFHVHHHKSEGVKYFKCDCCAQEFTQKSHLERHVVAKHVVDKEFECDICSKRLIDQKALEKHVEGHDKPIKYFCDICSKGFKHKISLTRHLATKHENVFNCGQCSKCFTNKHEFDEHLNSKSSSKLKLEFKCQCCSEVLPSQCTLNVHIHSHSTKTKITKPEKATESSTSKIDVHQPKQEIKCEHCGKIFERETSFVIHRKHVHPNSMWKCDFEKCTKSYKYYSTFRNHKMTHSGLKAYVCPTCQKSFVLLQTLRQHQKTHLDEKKIKCKMCPKSFVSRTARRYHIANKHGGPKPFKCPVPNCGMTFPANSCLKPHLISHETKKLFKCKICTEIKEFKCLIGLKQHLRVVHSDVKKQSSRLVNQVVFICSAKECSSFKTGSEKEVAIHYNKQHGLPKVQFFQNIIKIENIPLGSVLSFSEEIPSCETKRLILKRYKCKFCLKLFSFSLFKKHPEKCSAKSVFKCSGCSKTFRYKNSLNKHNCDKHYKENEKLIFQKLD